MGSNIFCMKKKRLGESKYNNKVAGRIIHLRKGFKREDGRRKMRGEVSNPLSLLLIKLSTIYSSQHQIIFIKSI
jgi:hypothetical protein